jgi:hypothetical protein
MARKSSEVYLWARKAGRRTGGVRARPLAAALLLAMALMFAMSLMGTVRAADAVAPQAVSRISLMSLGKFTFDSGGSANFADSIACTSTNGCVGVFGLDFPQFSLFVQVSGGFSCAPSDSPTTCTIAFTGGDSVACILTAYLPAVPGDGNPVDLVCLSPSGTGHGLSTLAVLT